MSVEQLKLALDAPIAGAAKSVLLVLAWYADSEGGRVWPSVPTVARQSGASERHVRRALIDLKTLGWLVLEKAASGKLANCYRLAIPLTPCHPGRSVTPDKASGHPGHGVRSTPDVVSATPDVVSSNPSGSAILNVSESGNARATPGSPHGPGARNGSATQAIPAKMTPEQVAAAKANARAAVGLPPARLAKPVPDRTEINAALAEIERRAAKYRKPA